MPESLHIDLSRLPDCESMEHAIRLCAYIHNKFGIKPLRVLVDKDNYVLIIYTKTGTVMTIDIDTLLRLEIAVTSSTHPTFQTRTIEFYVDDAMKKFFEM